MATPAYMSVNGEIQQLITENANTPASIGALHQSAHKHESTVQGFSHEIRQPCDLQSGMPTGLRVHEAVIVTKLFDSASPKLQQALCSGELLTSVVIKWYRTVNSAQQHYYTTTLKDAVITHIKDYMYNCQDPANAHFTHLEDVHFKYQEIIWEHVVATTTGSDNWRQPKMD